MGSAFFRLDLARALGAFGGTLFWPLVFESSTEFVCQVCALFSVVLVVLTYLLRIDRALTFFSLCLFDLLTFG